VILRNQVEWAIHCCSILGGLDPGETVSTKVLAELHGVPKEYLSKALQALATAGIVVGTLGPTGGYRLAKPAGAITFLDIVEAVEGRKSTFECTEIRANNPCLEGSKRRLRGTCAVARVMYRADEAWRSELGKVSLEDLAKDVVRDAGPELLERTGAWLRKR
jgi:Rrf2 family protein